MVRYGNAEAPRGGMALAFALFLAGLCGRLALHLASKYVDITDGRRVATVTTPHVELTHFHDVWSLEVMSNDQSGLSELPVKYTPDTYNPDTPVA